MDETRGELRPQDTKPSGELGGHPVNADETAPREHMPDAGGAGASEVSTGSNRTPESVDDEPGSDL